ncbi:hypothetical protein Tco_1461116 [Tanacetum coccineum]
MAPLSFALSESEADDSNRSGSGTHHSASPLNTIIPNDADRTTGGDGLVLESANRAEDDTDHNIDNVEDTTDVNSPFSGYSPIPNTLLPPTRIHMFALVVKPFRSAILAVMALVAPYEPMWDMMINLATPAVRDQQNRLSDYQALQCSWFELGRRALAQINILQRYEALNEDYGELYESH